MDAEQVWKLWRRLLRDETLQQQLYDAQGATQWLEHFPDDERAILQAYASQFERVKWFVENYQFRLVNSFINALETGAPLTLRALLNIGLDLPALSKAFLRQQNWFDYGPRVYGYCDAALGFMLERQELAPYPQIRDLMGLERECVRLYTGLVEISAVVPGHYQRTDGARIYQSRYALSHWLRDKSLLGRSSPEETRTHPGVFAQPRGPPQIHAHQPARGAPVSMPGATAVARHLDADAELRRRRATQRRRPGIAR